MATKKFQSKIRLIRRVRRVRRSPAESGKTKPANGQKASKVYISIEEFEKLNVDGVESETQNDYSADDYSDEEIEEMKDTPVEYESINKNQNRY